MSKRKTKTKNNELVRVLRISEITSICISFCWLFFYFILSVKGGWDDINVAAILGAPVFAAIALIISLVRIRVEQKDGKIIVPALVALWMSALFFCAAAIIKTKMILAL